MRQAVLQTLGLAICAPIFSGCGSDEKRDPEDPPALCSNGSRDADESDIDCGGSCSPCEIGFSCNLPADCTTGRCVDNLCRAPESCSDEIENQDESDIDCGGSCSACTTGRACNGHSDCETSTCIANLCATPTCDDGVHNQDETDIDCGGGCASCDLVLCADRAQVIDNSGAGPWSATGEVAGDVFQASCTGGYEGADAVLRFVAPRAATYRFSSAGSDFDTLLSVRDDCTDLGTELACNDQFGMSDQAQVELALADQQEVFLLVDAYRGLSGQTYVLTAYDVADLPTPEVTSLDAVCNADEDALGILVTGTTPTQEIAVVRLQLLDGGGTPIDINGTNTLELELETSPYASVSMATNTFELRFSAPMAVSMTGVASISVQLADTSVDFGPVATAACVAPQVVGEGGTCDPFAGFDQCATGTRCAEPEQPSNPAVCASATAPQTSQMYASHNNDRHSLGVSVEGQDLEQNAWYVHAVLLDGQMEPLRQDPEDDQSALLEPVLMELDLQWVGDEFMGRAGLMLESVVAATVHFYALRVSVVDRTGLSSTPTDVGLAAPQALYSADACDLVEALGICPTGEVCAYDDGNFGSPTICQTPAAACPQEWSLTDLNTHAVDSSSWQIDAVVSSGDNLGGSGSCGGGGPQAVLTFVATESGRYSFALTAEAADPLLFMRSHCTLPQAEFELGCNDDVDLAARDFSAWVEQILHSGDRVFLFVDGHVGGQLTGMSGDYQLTAAFEGSVP